MSTSLDAAIQEAVPLRLGPLPDPEQLELLRGADGNLPRGAIHSVRTGGRPRGARNKRTKKIADYFVAKHGDPLDVLGSIMNTPLKQLVEVLREADGSEEREARLLDLADEAKKLVQLARAKGEVSPETLRDAANLIERISDMEGELSSRPGKLALDALTVQLQATFRALEYVHGKQPVSVEVSGRADLVVFAPEILKQHGIDAGELQSAVESRGLEAFDADEMRLLPPVDAEFSEVEEEAR